MPGVGGSTDGWTFILKRHQRVQVVSSSQSFPRILTTNFARKSWRRGWWEPGRGRRPTRSRVLNQKRDLERRTPPGIRSGVHVILLFCLYWMLWQNNLVFVTNKFFQASLIFSIPPLEWRPKICFNQIGSWPYSKISGATEKMEKVSDN